MELSSLAVTPIEFAQSFAVLRMESFKAAIARNPILISILKQRLTLCGAVVAGIFFSSSLQGASVTLAWNSIQDDPLVIGYTVRYGTNSGRYSDFLVSGPSTSATVTGLSEGVSYFFAVSAYTLTGLESDPSEEISYTVPGGNPIGDQPTLNPIGNVFISEDAGQQTITLSGVTAGVGGILQLVGLGVTASSSNPLLIPNPTVSYTSPSTTGTLRFSPVSNQFGTTTISVTVNNFKLLNNLFSRTFTVTVNAINDAPTLNTLNNLAIGLNAGPQTVSLTGISAGAGNEGQSVTVTATSSNPGLVPNPTVSYAAGASIGALTFASQANASGTATITVAINDGQNQNNTISRSFNVTVGNPSANAQYVEAESGVVTSPMLSALDSNASNSRYVYSQTDNQGSLSLQVNILQAGDYVVWCRVLSPNEATDSFFVSVDGGSESTYGTAQNTWSSGWQWTKVNGDNGVSGNPRTFTLSQGIHTFNFRGREKSTRLDALFFTTDRNFVPLQAPRLAISPTSFPSPGTQVSFLSSIGARYDLQASDDLVSWTNVWNSPVTTANQLLTYVDTVQRPSVMRFYRLQVR